MVSADGTRSGIVWLIETKALNVRGQGGQDIDVLVPEGGRRINTLAQAERFGILFRASRDAFTFEGVRVVSCGFVAVRAMSNCEVST